MRGTARTAQRRARATRGAALRVPAPPLACAAALLLLIVPGCSRERATATVPAVDLLRQFDRAERRPPNGLFELKEHTLGGVSRATLVVPAESRVTWRLFVPHRGRLQMSVGFPESTGASVEVRVGISDGRIYNTIAEQRLTTTEGTKAWIPFEADLSMYAGRKWSLFYRPDRTQWGVIVGTHVIAGSVPQVFLGTPVLVTDVEGAREYLRRITEM